jgi:hypothetical protein
MQSVSHQRKVGDKFFSELLVVINTFRANVTSATKDDIENKWTERIGIKVIKKSIFLWAATPYTSVEIYHVGICCLHIRIRSVRKVSNKQSGPREENLTQL